MPEPMTDAQDSIDELRRQINAIDSEIHDLLMRRSELATEVGKQKGNSTIFMRPGREAQILRRLMARHVGSFPKPVVVQIWREIISAATALEGPFSVAVHAPPDGVDLRALARAHYGCLRPLTSFESVTGVLRAVTEGQATLGILPLSQSSEGMPWWRSLARDGKGVPRVVARLPYATRGTPRDNGAEGLAVALAEQDVSGHDRSYLVLETEQPISRGALQTLLTNAGLKTLDFKTWDDAPDRQMHLVEVDDYVAAGDQRLTRLMGLDDEIISHSWAIGGYSVPLNAEELMAAETPVR